MTFGERLLQHMGRAKLSQRQLAEKIGVTPTRLNYWVKDKREPDLEHIRALAQALEITADALLGTEGAQTAPGHTADGGVIGLTEEEAALLTALRSLDAPGRATVAAVLTAEQQRIAAYGSIEPGAAELSRRRIPVLQGTHEAEIQIGWLAKKEKQELEYSQETAIPE